MLPRRQLKEDMESERPMDRLGLRGCRFWENGSEPIRAAFKVVDNGRQVAVLVPTTILAFQHYKNFAKRLEDFPLRVRLPQPI